MGLDRDRALASMRLSVGRWTSVEDVDRTASQLSAACVVMAG